MRDFPVDDEDGAIARYREQHAILEDDAGAADDDEGSGSGADVYATGIDRPTLKKQVFEEMVDAGSGEVERVGNLAQAGPRIDDLDRKVALREAKWEDYRAEAKWIRITPPSVLRGTLGGQQLVMTDPLVRRTQQVALWQGEDAEATIVTVTGGAVQLPRFDPTALGPFPRFRPFGIVKWGVRGWMFEAEFDLCRGVQFSVEASAISLQVGLEASAATGSLQLAAELGFLPCQKTNPATLTAYIDAAGAGSTTRIDVPAFAREVWFNRTPATEPIRLDFIDSTGTTVSSVPLIASQFMDKPVPLSSDIVQVAVVDAAAGGYTGRLIFGLSF